MSTPKLEYSAKEKRCAEKKNPPPKAGIHKTLFGFAAAFLPVTAQSFSKYTKYFFKVISCYRQKIKRQNCEALQKRRFLCKDKKNRYGKAAACHSGFLQYWQKRLILKRILSYEAPP